MSTIRAHSRTVVFLSFATVLAVAGIAWWLLSGGAPTNAQVIADACDGAERATSGSMTSRNFPATTHLMVAEADYNPTAGRLRITFDGVLVEQSIYTIAPDQTSGTRDASGRATYQVTQYDQALGDDNQLSEWTAEETTITSLQIHAGSFCGYAPGELSDLRYVGTETINGVNARHYTAIAVDDGSAMDLWIGPNGLPTRARSTIPEGGAGAVADFRWGEPITITAPTQSTPTPTTTAPNPTPTPVQQEAVTPTPSPTSTPVPVPTDTPEPTETPVPASAWLEPDPETVTFDGSEWLEFTVHGTGVDHIDFGVNVWPGSIGAVGSTGGSSPPSVSEACESTSYTGYTLRDGWTVRLVGCQAGTVIIRLGEYVGDDYDYVLFRQYTVTVSGGP